MAEGRDLITIKETRWSTLLGEDVLLVDHAVGATPDEIGHGRLGAFFTLVDSVVANVPDGSDLHWRQAAGSMQMLKPGTDAGGNPIAFPSGTVVTEPSVCTTMELLDHAGTVVGRFRIEMPVRLTADNGIQLYAVTFMDKDLSVTNPAGILVGQTNQAAATTILSRIGAIATDAAAAGMSIHDVDFVAVGDDPGKITFNVNGPPSRGALAIDLGSVAFHVDGHHDFGFTISAVNHPGHVPQVLTMTSHIEFFSVILAILAGTSTYLSQSSGTGITTTLTGLFAEPGSSAHYRRLGVATLAIDTQYTDTSSTSCSWTMDVGAYAASLNGGEIYLVPQLETFTFSQETSIRVGIPLPSELKARVDKFLTDMSGAIPGFNDGLATTPAGISPDPTFERFNIGGTTGTSLCVKVFKQFTGSSDGAYFVLDLATGMVYMKDVVVATPDGQQSIIATSMIPVCLPGVIETIGQIVNDLKSATLADGTHILLQVTGRRSHAAIQAEDTTLTIIVTQRKPGVESITYYVQVTKAADGSPIYKVSLNGKRGLDLVPGVSPIPDAKLEPYRRQGFVQTHVINGKTEFRYFHEWCGMKVNGDLQDGLDESTFESRQTLTNWLRFIAGEDSPYWPGQWPNIPLE